jgi:hypothetical protein
MPETKHDFDQSFYVLCLIGYWILVVDALATPEGREKVKDTFRAGMLAAGSYAALQALPEFQAAMRDFQELASPPFITVAEEEVTPLPKGRA